MEVVVMTMTMALLRADEASLLVCDVLNDGLKKYENIKKY